MFCVGGSGALDWECGFDSGEQRPDVPPTEDPSRTHLDLLHPSDLPLHLREQAHGHHCQGTSHYNTKVCVWNDIFISIQTAGANINVCVFESFPFVAWLCVVVSCLFWLSYYILQDSWLSFWHVCVRANYFCSTYFSVITLGAIAVLVRSIRLCTSTC